MKISDKSYPSVVNTEDAKAGEVYGYGKTFFIKTNEDLFVDLSNGQVCPLRDMPRYLGHRETELLVTK